MSKVKNAQSISITNCSCCGNVHIEFWRDGQMFAVAVPATADIAATVAADMAKAADVMRATEGKPHVH